MVHRPAAVVPAPDGERIWSDLAVLSTFAEDREPGWTRQVFSEPYRASRPHVLELMTAAGLEAHIDGAGNVVGRLPGRNPSLSPLMTGSHTDTVHGGGRFDGMVGVIGAIESVRALKEAGRQLERDLIVVDFLGEEANPFGVSCLGSRAITGQLQREHFERTDGNSGSSMGQTMMRFGLDPDQVLRSAWQPGSLHGYLELHIEQGPLLERSGRQIGVVTAIAGIERLLARFGGRADHAGTMPMEGRRDALIAAAEAILTIEREACGAPIHGVSTTGRIESSPGSFNIVPDEAKIWAEVRSVDSSWLVGAKGRIARQIADQASSRGVEVMLDWLNDQPPVLTTQTIQDVVGESADALGLSWEAVPSGAGHDAAHMTHLGPLGMVFVPSVGGRSHVPEELTERDDIVNGVNVLLQSLMKMDKQELA
jgi:beta-ureidopropionase / N-carbamoyl-L-amino-acid hydrolase